MKKHKKIFMILVTLLIGTFLTACNKEEKDFMDAFIKSQEILSLESTSNVELNLDVKGLDDETQAIFDESISQVNGMKLRTNQKSVSNKEQTRAKGQIDANIQLSDINFDSSVWVDVDLSEEKPVLKEVFKLPSKMMNSLPGGEGKEYIILDFETMNQSIVDMEDDMAQPMNLDETMAIAMKYQDKFMDAFVDYMKNYDSNLPLVSQLDDKEVDGEKIKYYQVKFDNDSFKEFLKYTSLSILEDENIIPLFEEYMNELMELSGEEIQEEISMTDNIEERIKGVKEFFDKLEKLNILGEEGIVVTYGINEAGYFVSEEGKMDFKIDTKEIINLMPKAMEKEEELNQENYDIEQMPTPIIELMISYDTKTKNINQDMEVTMPEITKENSLDYMDLIEEMVLESQQDMELMVIVEDEFVELTNEPMLVDDNYLISSKDIATAFDAEISWNGDTEEIIIAKDENKLIFKENSDQFLLNSMTKDLRSSVIIVDGVSFIPLRVVSENIGYNVQWDGEFNLISIYK